MDIKPEIRRYIVENFLSDGNGAALDDATPLITGGLIDSIGMVGLVGFIESRFRIEFLPREVDPRQFDSVEKIAQLIQEKMARYPRPGCPPGPSPGGSQVPSSGAME